MIAVNEGKVVGMKWQSVCMLFSGFTTPAFTLYTDCIAHYCIITGNSLRMFSISNTVVV